MNKTSQNIKNRSETKVGSFFHPINTVGRLRADKTSSGPQVAFVSNYDDLIAANVSSSVASSLTGYQPARPLQDDLQLFSNAVNGVLDAARDGVITQQEADSILEMLSRALTERRVDAAFFHLFNNVAKAAKSFGTR